MSKSYSKIRHIQESNQRLENNYLSEQNANLAGLGARVNTTLTNVGNTLKGKGELNRNPKVEAAFARVTAKEKQLRDTLRDFKFDFERLYSDRKVDLEAKVKKMKEKGRKNAPEVENRLTLLDNLFKNLSTKITEIETLINNSIYAQKGILTPNPDETEEVAPTQNATTETPPSEPTATNQ